MTISIISFTKRGFELSKKIQISYVKDRVRLYTKGSFFHEIEVEKDIGVWVEESIGSWAKDQMEKQNGVVFIGACGIAVRAIAPSIQNKLCDSPVLVLDEMGQYVIPILSGHVGGANELAKEIASAIGAIPVITTATDLNHAFAVDVFAKKNHLQIVNQEGIAKISSKILAGKKVTLSVEKERIEDENKCPDEVVLVEFPPKETVDIVISEQNRTFPALLELRVRPYVMGVGCRKGKSIEELADFFQEVLEEWKVEVQQVGLLTSIEQKKEEAGLKAWSKAYDVPFVTYTAEELQQVSGTFSGSTFVEAHVGIDNVCERSAMRACGEKGALVGKKRAKSGMTMALAKKDWRISLDET